MIDKLLRELGEDKHTNFTTTSDKFKADIWRFFSDDSIVCGGCVELGTHKGQTTKILSYLYDRVYTVNISEESLHTARTLNGDRSNIEYFAMDLYGGDITHFRPPGVTMVFIDAGHLEHQVDSDIRLAMDIMSDESSSYIVFDDFGMHMAVYNVISKYLEERRLIYISDIGHPIGYSFGGIPERKLLYGSEGIICKVNYGE